MELARRVLPAVDQDPVADRGKRLSTSNSRSSTGRFWNSLG